MIIRICSFTKTGYETVKKVSESMEDHLFDIKDENEGLSEWTREGFEIGCPIIFVGACGIAVRAIAPYVADKLSDSPVIVIDESGKNIIPILSGHVGGANELSCKIAKAIKGNAIITTATDVNSLFAVDVFAKKNGLNILNREGIRKVSSKLLEKRNITIAVDSNIEVIKETIPNEVKLLSFDTSEADVAICSNNAYKGKALLTLKAAEYVLGIGCKRDTECKKIEEAVAASLNEINIDINDLAAIASIDLKKKERGLLEFASKSRRELVTFSSDELNELEGDFSQSEFVKTITGVSNVCERSAMCCAGNEAELVFRKKAYDGVTVAIARRKVVLNG